MMENGSRIHGCGRGVLHVSLVLSLVSVVLQVVGLATTGWMILYAGSRAGRVEFELKVSMGLWNVNYCINDQCKTKSISGFYSEDVFGGSIDGLSNAIESSLNEYRIETVGGAVLMFAAFSLWQLRNPTQGQTKKSLYVVISVCSAISAFLSLLAAGKWGKNLADAHKLLGPRSPYLVPYSVYITGAGGILAFIIAVILAIAAYRESQGTSINQGQTIAMTGYPPASHPYVVQGNRPPWGTNTNQGQGIAMTGYPPASQPYVVQGNHPPRGTRTNQGQMIDKKGYPPAYRPNVV